MNRSRTAAFLLLASANVFWAGNWVIGRALRVAFEPVALNFWRWVVAAAVLAPFALAGAVANCALIRRHAGVLFLLALTGVTIFQSLVYLGLRSTTTVNAVLLNSSAPLFMLLCSWVIEHEHATRRQIAGVLISLVGILVILSRGEFGNLLQLEFHAGDGWILLAMPVWGVYSVLLKRRPPGLGGLEFLFIITVAGVLMLAPFYAFETLHTAPALPALPAIAGVLYIGVAASVFAFVFWNRGVSVVGANAAGFTLHLLPAFGTVFAIIFLGESFRLFHAFGIATILAGVALATHQARLSGRWRQRDPFRPHVEPRSGPS
jgi:drug/metabolite transporter (DMT)-like permease